MILTHWNSLLTRLAVSVVPWLLVSFGAHLFGSAWGAIAVLYNKILIAGNIYKFPVTVRRICQAGTFRSRLLDQPIELRFSGLSPPEEVRHSPYPDIDYQQFTANFDSLKTGKVASVVGLVIGFPVSDTNPHVVLSNGYGDFSMVPLYTVLGICGVTRVKDVRSRAVNRPNELADTLFESYHKLPNMMFESYEDTLIVTEPPSFL